MLLRCLKLMAMFALLAGALLALAAGAFAAPLTDTNVMSQRDASTDTGQFGPSLTGSAAMSVQLSNPFVYENGVSAGGIQAAAATIVSGQLRITSGDDHLAALPYVLVQTSDGNWHVYPNPHGARSVLGVTSWGEREIVLSDAALAGATVTRVVSSSSSLTPPPSVIDDLPGLAVHVAGAAATVEITSAPDAVSTTRDARFTLTVTGTPAATECRIDGSVWFACAGQVAYSDIGEGVHQFEARVRSSSQVLDADQAAWSVDLPAKGQTAMPAVIEMGRQLSSGGAIAVAHDSEGRTIVAGRVHTGGGYQLALLRYLPDGTLDASFAAGGRMIASEADGSLAVVNIVEARDGGIYVLTNEGVGSGARVRHGILRKYTEAGAPDMTFSIGSQFDGASEAPRPASVPVGAFHDMAVQDDGKVLITGTETTDGRTPARGVLLRLNTDGTLDETYALAGRAVMLPTGMVASQALQVSYQRATGAAVVTGSAVGADANNHQLITRRTQTGALDTSYGAQGYLLDVGMPSAQAQDLWTRIDGTSYMSFGGSANSPAAASFTSAGLPDVSYSASLPQLTSSMLPPSPGPDSQLSYRGSGQSAQRGGGLYMAGTVYRTTAGKGSEAVAIVAFSILPDGAPDTSFGPSGMRIIDDLASTGARSDAVVLDLALSADGHGATAAVTVDNVPQLLTF